MELTTKNLPDIQKRIKEILEIFKKQFEPSNELLGLEERYALEAELDLLKTQQKFLFDTRRESTNLYLGVGSILIGITAIIASVIISFLVPYRTRVSNENAQIETIYKDLVTNADIDVANANGIRELENATSSDRLPELYIETVLDDKSRQILQNSFGLVQYRFFLYYLQQTSLLNKEIRQIQKEFLTATSTKSLKELAATIPYTETMKTLQLEGRDTKFNYGKDTECLQHFFEKNFAYLTIDGRGQTPECSSDTLAWRLFYHFGYLEADTPQWIKPELKRALNDREPGLGDRCIRLE